MSGTVRWDRRFKNKCRERLRYSLSSRDTLYRPSFFVFLSDSLMGGTFPSSAGSSPHGRFSCYLQFYAGKHVDLPSSQAPPMSTCPVLRPRWCPEHSPRPDVSACLTYSGLLPSARSKASAFLLNYRSYPAVHHYTFFGAQYKACTLDPSGFGHPLSGLPSDFTSDPLAKL
jgi:hypothetical protein